MTNKATPARRHEPNTAPAPRSSAGDIKAFLASAKAAQPTPSVGRLILALDATMSRQPTWDLACRLQGEMFDAVGRAGGLSVQLTYFRGFGECRASRFVADTQSLKNLMVRIDCRGGKTQIGKILANAAKENRQQKVAALIFIGDAMEENVDALTHRAGELGLGGVPVFIFQEGRDAEAERAFREIARLSRGAWFRFDAGAAATVGRLLSSIAVFATGGIRALEARGRSEDRLLIQHLREERDS